MHPEPPANPTPSADPNPPLPEAAKPAKRRHIPHLAAWLLAIFVLVVFVGIAMPVPYSCGRVSEQTKSLGRAKQIGLALKLFAGDHDDEYPHQGNPVEMTQSAADSNQAFACLFPTYTQSEATFGVEQSAYQTGTGPDNIIDNPYTGHPKETLRPGENVYAYIMGLTDALPATAPLVLDGTAGNAHYVSDPKKRGGVWKGNKVVIIRLDNSGAVETPTGPPDARIVPDRDHPGGNLLDMARFDPGVRLLDPAVAGGASAKK